MDTSNLKRPKWTCSPPIFISVLGSSHAVHQLLASKTWELRDSPLPLMPFIKSTDMSVWLQTASCIGPLLPHLCEWPVKSNPPISPLDSCNSFQVGLPASALAPVVHPCTADRVIFLNLKSNHVTTFPGWKYFKENISVPSWMKYEISWMAFQALDNQVFIYLLPLACFALKPSNPRAFAQANVASWKAHHHSVSRPHLFKSSSASSLHISLNFIDC